MIKNFKKLYREFMDHVNKNFPIHPHWKFFLIIVLVNLIIDVSYLTPTAMAAGGFVEANPIHRAAYQAFGLIYFYAVLPFLVITLYISFLVFRRLFFVMVALSMVSMFVITNNLYWLFGVETASWFLGIGVLMYAYYFIYGLLYTTVGHGKNDE